MSDGDASETDQARADELRLVDDLAITSAKTLLRRAVVLRRDLRATAVRQGDDAARFELIRRRLERQRVSVVAAYLSSGSEPGTLQLVAWLAAREVQVLLPVLTTSGGLAGEPAWAPYAGPDALRVGFHAILEPTTEVLAADALAGAELIICPALAANTDGDRLGRGGGWYDRALRRARADVAIWGLLNDNEVLETIPTQSWDRRLTGIVTSSRFIRCGRDATG